MAKLENPDLRRGWKRIRGIIEGLHGSIDEKTTIAAIHLNLGIPVRRILRDMECGVYGARWPVMLGGLTFFGRIDSMTQDWALEVLRADSQAEAIFSPNQLEHLMHRNLLYISPSWRVQERIIDVLKRTFGLSYLLFHRPAHRRGSTIGWLGFVWSLSSDGRLLVAQRGGGHYPITGWMSLLKARVHNVLAHPVT